MLLNIYYEEFGSSILHRLTTQNSKCSNIGQCLPTLSFMSNIHYQNTSRKLVNLYLLAVIMYRLEGGVEDFGDHSSPIEYKGRSTENWPPIHLQTEKWNVR